MLEVDDAEIKSPRRRWVLWSKLHTGGGCCGQNTTQEVDDVKVKTPRRKWVMLRSNLHIVGG